MKEESALSCFLKSAVVSTEERELKRTKKSLLNIISPVKPVSGAVVLKVQQRFFPPFTGLFLKPRVRVGATLIPLQTMNTSLLMEYGICVSCINPILHTERLRKQLEEK